MILVSAPASPPEGVAKPNRDERYSSSHSYRYDNAGKLVEARTLGNDGELSYRHTVRVANNQREILNYDSDNKLISKTINVLDAKGNVIEERRFDELGRLEASVVFAYELDQAGNWITRKSYKKRRGKTAPAPSAITYRRISYY
jgi:hypothetical protein